MHIAYVVVGLLTAFVSTVSGVLSIARVEVVVSQLGKAGVPRSWLVFPIGVLKAAGAAGVLLGLAGVPVVGAAAAAGLVVFYSCAVHTHLLARDYSVTFALALGYLGLATTTLALALAS